MGRSRRKTVRNEKKTRDELGARETVVEKMKNRRLLHVVWTCGTDGRRKTTNRGFTWPRGEKEKQREAKEDLDGQY